MSLKIHFTGKYLSLILGFGRGDESGVSSWVVSGVRQAASNYGVRNYDGLKCGTS
jgi:hypothetical protein